MRFTAASLFVGVVAAGMFEGNKPSITALPSASETVIYETHKVTVTSCPPEVTNCPAESIHVKTSVVAVSTTICPVEESEKAKPTGWGSWCDSETETCTVTVTKPKSWGTGGPWVPAKNMTSTAAAWSTGSPVQPKPSYYSNAAAPLQGGAVAIGAGILALFAL